MITDYYLNEIAKALQGSTYVYPTYLAFGTTVLTLSTTDSSLVGESGTRIALSSSRSNSAVTYSGTRLASQVPTSSGIYLNGLGLLSSSTAGTLLTEFVLSSVLHTTSYDIQVDSLVTVGRG